MPSGAVASELAKEGKKKTILRDLGNMKNPADSALMVSPDGQQKYADAVVRGIAGYLGVKSGGR
jgi:N-acetylmuramoyl-L-alanine amidase